MDFIPDIVDNDLFGGKENSIKMEKLALLNVDNYQIIYDKEYNDVCPVCNDSLPFHQIS
jgi:hypothetical protein